MKSLQIIITESTKFGEFQVMTMLQPNCNGLWPHWGSDGCNGGKSSGPGDCAVCSQATIKMKWTNCNTCDGEERAQGTLHWGTGTFALVHEDFPSSSWAGITMGSPLPNLQLLHVFLPELNLSHIMLQGLSFSQ